VHRHGRDVQSAYPARSESGIGDDGIEFQPANKTPRIVLINSNKHICKKTWMSQTAETIDNHKMHTTGRLQNK